MCLGANRDYSVLALALQVSLICLNLKRPICIVLFLQSLPSGTSFNSGWSLWVGQFRSGSCGKLIKDQMKARFVSLCSRPFEFVI